MHKKPTITHLIEDGCDFIDATIKFVDSESNEQAVLDYHNTVMLLAATELAGKKARGVYLEFERVDALDDASVDTPTTMCVYAVLCDGRYYTAQLAEGVDTIHQLATSYAQGYVFSDSILVEETQNPWNLLQFISGRVTLSDVRLALATMNEFVTAQGRTYIYVEELVRGNRWVTRYRMDTTDHFGKLLMMVEHRIPRSLMDKFFYKLKQVLRAAKIISKPVELKIEYPWGCSKHYLALRIGNSLITMYESGPLVSRTLRPVESMTSTHVRLWLEHLQNKSPIYIQENPTEYVWANTEQMQVLEYDIS